MSLVKAVQAGDVDTAAAWPNPTELAAVAIQRASLPVLAALVDRVRNIAEHVDVVAVAARDIGDEETALAYVHVVTVCMHWKHGDAFDNIVQHARQIMASYPASAAAVLVMLNAVFVHLDRVPVGTFYDTFSLETIAKAADAPPFCLALLEAYIFNALTKPGGDVVAVENLLGRLQLQREIDQEHCKFLIDVVKGTTQPLETDVKFVGNGTFGCAFEYTEGERQHVIKATYQFRHAQDERIAVEKIKKLSVKYAILRHVIPYVFAARRVFRIPAGPPERWRTWFGVFAIGIDMQHCGTAIDRWKFATSLADGAFALLQVAVGLQLLHGENIHHNDISAGNVLVFNRRRYVLIDFGKAGRLEPQTAWFDALKSGADIHMRRPWQLTLLAELRNAAGNIIIVNPASMTVVKAVMARVADVFRDGRYGAITDEEWQRAGTAFLEHNAGKDVDVIKLAWLRNADAYGLALVTLRVFLRHVKLPPDDARVKTLQTNMVLTPRAQDIGSLICILQRFAEEAAVAPAVAGAPHISNMTRTCFCMPGCAITINSGEQKRLLLLCCNTLVYGRELALWVHRVSKTRANDPDIAAGTMQMVQTYEYIRLSATALSAMCNQTAARYTSHKALEYEWPGVLVSRLGPISMPLHACAQLLHTVTLCNRAGLYNGCVNPNNVFIDDDNNARLGWWSLANMQDLDTTPAHEVAELLHFAQKIDKTTKYLPWQLHCLLGDAPTGHMDYNARVVKERHDCAGVTILKERFGYTNGEAVGFASAFHAVAHTHTWGACLKMLYRTLDRHGCAMLALHFAAKTPPARQRAFANAVIAPWQTPDAETMGGAIRALFATNHAA